MIEPSALRPVVAFDVGETLVDETRFWLRHAARLDIPAMTFFGVFGALVAEGRHHREVFTHFGVDASTYLAEVDALDDPDDGYLPCDVYPDAARALSSLRAAGHRIAVAGNQPERAEEEIRAFGIEVDVVATSAGWGVSKPDPAFFERLATECAVEPDQVTYVGDRVDNDVLPSKQAGMQAILIRRGVWGQLHATWRDADRADRVIASLDELIP